MAKSRSLSLTVKGLVVGALILLLLIPSIIIGELVGDRSSRQREAVDEVSAKWAHGQKLIGPILIIPYWETQAENVRSGGSVTEISKQVRKLCYVLPDQLTVNGELQPQTRKRSIFKITVYQAGLDIHGTFAPIDYAALGLQPGQMIPDQAQVCLGLSDFRGIEKQIDIRWDTLAMPLSTGMVRNDVIDTGLAAPVVLTDGPHTFSMKLNLRGSEEFFVTPVGMSTSVKLSSTCADPSFTGNFLPNLPAEITKDGFTAEWNVLSLNREYPQAWCGDAYDTSGSSFGVELMQPTDTYAKTTKAVKYAILFIALTFVVCFLLEVLQRRNMHPLQYVLVGLALCLFYTLLLSIGEYTGFNWAYLIASAATIALITWYAHSIFRKWAVAMLFAGVLGMLYAFIFILLQLQDGALLFGSIGLFILLGAIMYYSRKVDWQTEELPEGSNNTPTPPPYQQ